MKYGIGILIVISKRQNTGILYRWFLVHINIQAFIVVFTFGRIIRKDILMSKVWHSSTAEINSIYKITITYEKGLNQDH